ncbi:unnamed protein product [Schistocephalus solidus]|uniref:Transmembrane protein 79 n=1 Tax=Schistocephalus solidus TaxID=70667 RepID=A0A183SZ14_SCHSO|nr:unnamed protein product [Schistocephalus solidus]
MPEIQNASEPSPEDAKEKPPDQVERQEIHGDVLVDSETIPQDSGENRPRKHHRGKKEHDSGLTTPSESAAHATFVLGERPIAEAEEENRLIPAFVQLSVLCFDSSLQNPPQWREVARVYTWHVTAGSLLEFLTRSQCHLSGPRAVFMPDLLDLEDVTNYTSPPVTICGIESEQLN